MDLAVGEPTRAAQHEPFGRSQHGGTTPGHTDQHIGAVEER